MTHDKFCTYRTEPAIMSDIVVSPCTCDYVAQIRADEREKAAQRVYTRAREIAEANLKREHRVDTISTWILLAAAARGEDKK